MLEHAQKDFLTGCFAKESLIPFLEKAVYEAKINKKNLSIALIDIDNFKKFNDKYGHIFGDDLLRYIVSTIKLTLEYKAYIFRYGGDEFLAVFLDKPRKEAAQLALACNRNIINRRFLYRDTLYKVTISCGVASFPDDAWTKEELLSKADEAMYASKRFGGNRTTEISRIKFMRLRRISKLAAVACLILLSLYLIDRYIHKGVIPYVIRSVKSVKVTAELRDLDALVLKNGDVIKGYIIAETDDIVTISFKTRKGEASFTFNKSEIAEIKYRSKPPGK